MTQTATTRSRTNADGSLACQPRDVSCCAPCAAADPRIVDVVGAHYRFDTVAGADAMRAELGEPGAARHDLSAWNCQEPYDGMTYADRVCEACE